MIFFIRSRVIFHKFVHCFFIRLVLLLLSCWSCGVFHFLLIFSFPAYARGNAARIVRYVQTRTTACRCLADDRARTSCPYPRFTFFLPTMWSVCSFMKREEETAPKKQASELKHFVQSLFDYAETE